MPTIAQQSPPRHLRRQESQQQPRSCRDSHHSHGDSSSSSSSSSSSDECSDINSISVIWPPENSIPWPPPNYDDFLLEATIDLEPTTDTTPHPAQPLLYRPPSVRRYYGSADVFSRCEHDIADADASTPRRRSRTWMEDVLRFLSPLSRRVEEKRLQWMESDEVTPLHSNRHLVVGGGEGEDRWNDSSDDDDDDDDDDVELLWDTSSEGSERRNDSNPSLLHRHYDTRHRHHAYMIRIWQTLSVGVMIVFCVCLVVMPSVLQKSEREGHTSKSMKHGGAGTQYDMYYGGRGEGGKESVSTGINNVVQDEKEDGEWKYPKPWKYLFGKENGEEEDGDDEGVDQDVGVEVHEGDVAPNQNNGTQDETSLSPLPIDTNQDSTSNDNPPPHDDDDNDTTSSLINTNITFASLASIMLPPYFETTLQLCKSTITPYHPPSSKRHEKSPKRRNNSKQTHSISPLQPQNMLKTRDLFDVFSPVYPPHYSGYTHYRHEGDLDFQTRDVLWATGEDLDLTLESGEKKRHRGRRKDDAFGRGWFLAGSKHEATGRRGKGGSLSRNRYEEEEEKKKEEMYDLWKILRKFLDDGYTIIGDFQDLDHAKIEYTPEQLAQYQLVVWEWHVEFMTFATRNYLDIMRYLSNPCPIVDDEENNDEKRGKSKSGKTSKEQEDASRPSLPSCRYSHSKSSHLFWGGTPNEDLPDGNQVAASRALGRLGSEQLERAQQYLNMLWTKDHVISKADVNEPVEKERASKHSSSGGKKSDNDPLTQYLDAPVEEEDDGVNVHEVYHNLRKEFRSFLDEVDLFGKLLLPDTMVQPEVIVLGLMPDTALDGEVIDAANNEVVDPPSVVHDQQPINVGVAGKEAIEDFRQKTFDALTAIGQTRKLLGDLNDDYTAYTKYVEWNTNFGEQVRLMGKIEAEWNHFRWWAAQIDLNGQIDFLRSRMAVAATASPSLQEVDDGAANTTTSPTEEQDAGVVNDVSSAPRQGEDVGVVENPGAMKNTELKVLLVVQVMCAYIIIPCYVDVSLLPR
eukprot:CCRYP_014318-RA/>CCRYP_014318-RA protein AED:0.07 eAED:0.19 QI:0/0.33/0.25/1/0.66/0.5/4/1668/1021